MKAAPEGASTPSGGLTHLLDLSERQAAMKATRCSVNDCPNRHHARGLCAQHYYAAKKRNALPPVQEMGTAERLKRGLRAVPSGCLVWTGGRDTSGYGTIKADGVSDRTHRVAWVLANGPIPDDLCVLHHCDNPPCCNPAHLFLGTRTDNNEDKRLKGRVRNGRDERTHCPQGHEYAEANTYRYRNGRQCLTCRRERDATRKAERRDYMRRKRAAARATAVPATNGTTSETTVA